MKKNKNLKFFGLIAILTVALVFIGIDFVQGQVKTQGKPDKPPGKGKPEKYAWNAVILDGPFSIKGLGVPIDIPEVGVDGWVLNDSDPNVNVWVEIREAGSNYGAFFRIEIFYPAQIDFDYFLNQDAWPTAEKIEDALEYPELNEGITYLPCRYPGCEGEIDCSNPFCMFNFLLNHNHPHPAYKKVRLTLRTDWLDDPNVVDFERWTLYEDIGFQFRIDDGVIGSGGCEWLVPPSDYNKIEGGEGAYCQRMVVDENTDIWKFVVGKDIYGVDYPPGSDKYGWIYEYYSDCVLAPFNKKKNITLPNGFFPTFGSFDMNSEILFIRTKQ